MQLPNMNYRKGLFRAWAALSVVWVVFVAAVSLPSVFDLVEKKSVLVEMTPKPLPFEPADVVAGERTPRRPMNADMAQKIEIVQKIENDISRLKEILMCLTSALVAAQHRDGFLAAKARQNDADLLFRRIRLTRSALQLIRWINC